VRILLTGATGFVGGHAAGRLAAAGHEVRALTRGRDDGGVLAACGAEAVRGSLEDGGSLRAAADGCDAVVHAAGLIKAARPSDLHAVNADGTLRLLEACLRARRPPRRFVLVSSLAAQGPAAGAPLDPASPPRPVSRYGESKLRAERIALAFADRLEVVVVRPPAVYGPGDRETLSFFRIAAAGFRPRLAGRDLRLSLVHAEDLGDGLAAAAAAPAAAAGRVYHLCHREVLTFGGVMDAMAAAVGTRGRAVVLPRALLRGAGAVAEVAAALLGRIPDFGRDKARELVARAWTADPSTAARDLGWTARILSSEGIPATAAWYRERGWIR
jgi:dihydroflavonol-4-reductase